LEEKEAKMTSSTACWILVFVLFAALLVEPIVGPSGFQNILFKKKQYKLANSDYY
jgi:hypothetical protein